MTGVHLLLRILFPMFSVVMITPDHTCHLQGRTQLVCDINDPPPPVSPQCSDSQWYISPVNTCQSQGVGLFEPRAHLLLPLLRPWNHIVRTRWRDNTVRRRHLDTRTWCRISWSGVTPHTCIYKVDLSTRTTATTLLLLPLLSALIHRGTFRRLVPVSRKV